MIKDLIVKEIERSPQSRYEICKATGIKESVLSRLVSGERGISLKAAEILLEYFGYKIVKKTKLKRSKK